MALPVIKYPHFTTQIPSTGEEITFRPYTAGEEKIFLIAAESKDSEQIKLALEQVIMACVVTPIDLQKLATFDIEHIYLQLVIRSSSNESIVNIQFTDCPNVPLGELCPEVTQIKINLEDIKLKVVKDDVETEFKPGSGKKNKQIKLSDDLGVKLRFPSFKDLDISKTILEGADIETIGFELLARCTVAFHDKESIYTTDDVPLEDTIAFYKALPLNQVKKADEFFKSIPSLTYKREIICKKCQKKTEYKLQGINSFFT